MASAKRWRIVCYDVRDPARWRKVYKTVRGAGTHVQYSVFRCRLDDREVERLRWELAKVMSPQDALLIMDLCPRCAKQVVSRNHVAGWDLEPATFRILGGEDDRRNSGDHEPPAGDDRTERDEAETREGTGELRSLTTE